MGTNVNTGTETECLQRAGFPVNPGDDQKHGFLYQDHSILCLVVLP